MKAKYKRQRNVYSMRISSWLHFLSFLNMTATFLPSDFCWKTWWINFVLISSVLNLILLKVFLIIYIVWLGEVVADFLFHLLLIRAWIDVIWLQFFVFLRRFLGQFFIELWVKMPLFRIMLLVRWMISPMPLNALLMR